MDTEPQAAPAAIEPTEVAPAPEIKRARSMLLRVLDERAKVTAEIEASGGTDLQTFHLSVLNKLLET
jgi:hypothetical protein